MVEEKEEVQPEKPAGSKKGGKKNLIIIIIVVAVSLVLGAGGFIGYKMLIEKGNGNGNGNETHKKQTGGKTIIVGLDPFVLNLSDRGRYLKLSIQLEVSDESLQEAVKDKAPQLRDTIIMLVSSKSSNSVSSPEGKFQLKDEILFRANQVMGMDKDVFKNIYFTEFVMQ